MATDATFVDMYEREEAADRVVANAKRWRRRFICDARNARKMRWWNPMRFWGGDWSWTVTREQGRRFRKSEDPMRDYPDEIFERWVYDPLIGASRDEQKRAFDAYIAPPQAKE